MPAARLTFDKLLLCDPSKSRSTSNVYTSQRSHAEEQSLGRLFILTEISSRDNVNIDIISTIQTELEASYFGTDDLNVETAFERALERANQKVADLVGDYEINWLDKFNALVAIVKDDVLHFSTVGKVHAFIIRGEKITDILNTAAVDESLQDKINPLKAFSNIISGNLQENDTVAFCTTSLLDYISQEKLKRTLIDATVSNAVASLDRILSEDTSTAFAAIVIRLQAASVATPVYRTVAGPAALSQPTASAVPTAPQSSLDDLMYRQSETNKVLSPSLTRHLMETARRSGSKVADFIKLKLFKQSPRRVTMDREMRYRAPAPDKKAVRQSTLVSIFAAIYQGIVAVVVFIGRALTSLFKQRKKIASDVKAAPKTFTQKVSSMITGIKRLPKMSRYLLALVLIVAFGLAQSIFSLALSKEEAVQSVEYDSSIATVSENILKAEAAISYGNESGARELLDEAQSIINSLPSKTDEQAAKIAELHSDIALQLGKLRHVVSVESPTVLATFDQDGVAAGTTELAIAGQSLYALDPAKKILYRADKESGEVAALAHDEDKTFQYVIGQTPASLLLFTTANGLAEFDTESEEFSNLAFDLTTGDVNIIGIAPYEGRLYLLDIKNNQVYRSYRSGNGYGTPTEWLKDDTNLRETKSIAIDGFIYILQKNGTVDRLFQGARQDWSLDTVDPQLTQADSIVTDTTTDNLYVLDIQGKRILEFAKDGSFLNQYTSPAFANIKDFTVDYGSKKLYVLNGNTLFALDLQ
ncbi:MAG: hypothetical protein WC505_06605 [Patescibacteria group bacterium]